MFRIILRSCLWGLRHNKSATSSLPCQKVAKHVAYCKKGHSTRHLSINSLLVGGGITTTDSTSRLASDSFDNVGKEVLGQITEQKAAPLL